MDVRSFDDLVAGGGRRVSEIPAADAVAMHRNGDDLVYLDVRESNEWNLFRIPGAVHLPVGQVRDGVRDVIAPDQRVIVYCARGGRAAQAADVMRELGYERVATIKGGVHAWHEVGGELDQ
ncbi:MAG TPA: rhodanese-like domain-containing protein [Gemmatimonadaceae bacterium]|jgi:rhodanese-related sulfurtransferase|nr:rhodanese-like domain-containing protein [Gemmatimonadaceae bacterium]